MDPRGTFFPPALAQLVESKAQSQSLERELFDLFLRGRRRLTLGLGPGVDVPLLNEELSTAGLRLVDRDMVIATLRAEPEGYTLERPVTNFGIYVRNSTGWTSIPQGGELRNLLPGTVVGLGSTPADAVKVTLPEGPWVASANLPKSARHAQFATPRVSSAGPAFQLPEPGPEVSKETPTPPTHGPHSAYRTDPGHTGRTNPGRTNPGRTNPGRTNPGRTNPGHTQPPDGRRPTPGGVERRAVGRQPPPLPSREYEASFVAALLHWKYAMITFGGDPRSVLVLPDPALARLRAALMRNVDQPDRGYELFVKEPDPDLWVQPLGEPVQWMQRGGAIKLRGPGNRIGFGRWMIELPAPAAVTPRFGARVVPTRADVAAVLELTDAQLDDPELVKTRHRDLVRRFHPDRSNGDPGHLSRFVEIQQAFDAWKGR